MNLLGLHRETETRRASSASRLARRSAIAGMPSAMEDGRRCASIGPSDWVQQEADGPQKRSSHSVDRTPCCDESNSIQEASLARPRRPIRSASVVGPHPKGPSGSGPQPLQRSMSVMPPGSRRPSTGSVSIAAPKSSRPVGKDVPDGMRLATSTGCIEEREELTGSEYEDEDDIFAPTDERVQTVDFSRMRTQSIQITKNELRRKKDKVEKIKKQLKNFFHEDRDGPQTDEQGNVELPMNPFVQSREDHDSGLLPSQQLFRLARHEQQELQDRSIQHKQATKRRRKPNESVDDYEFAWIVRHASQSPLAAASSSGTSVIEEEQCDGQVEDKARAPKHRLTEGNTYQSKVGSNTIDFQERLNVFLRVNKPSSFGVRSECLGKMEQTKMRRAQLLCLNGLVESPATDALNPEEREVVQSFQLEQKHDSVDGKGSERFPCDCCGQAGSLLADTSHSAARYYDILFAHRKNDSFTVRFDLVHCLSRFVLHYKLQKQLYDCLDTTERKDLVKAATDITMSYNLDHCTLQMPFGKYRTNAYPAFFVYIIVPNHARYLEVFEVCNPPVKPGTRQKRNNCAIPNWPDKSYVTEFWTYSRESSSPSDKDPCLSTKLYEKNVLHKLQRVQMPELMVTRRNPPSEVVTRKPAKQQRGDLDIFEEFVLIPHQEQPMLGFGSVKHPGHASESRSPKPDIEFLHRLLQAMNSYVRRHVNTRQRRLDGREDLSCTVNLSLHHSYAFKGHQRVYGFIGFPPASTYWAALVKEQRQNAALAETAVTQEDIRLMRAANARAESASKANKQPGDDLATETSADRTELNGQIETDIREKLKSCNFL